MRMINHGVKSLVRRFPKTVMLFAIFFIVFNLIFIGFIIQNSIVESKEFIRNQIGSAVEYKMDFSAFLEIARNSNREQRQSRPPSLSLSVADKIAANSHVVNYFITDSANMNSEKISPVDTQESGGGFQRNFSDFTLSGSNKPEGLDFTVGNVKLVQGESLSQANLDNGDKVIIISSTLAEKNNLRLGDIVSLSRAAQRMPRNSQSDSQTSTDSQSASTIDFEIIGIYEANNDTFNENTIFASGTVVREINGTSSSDETNASIVYLLDNPDSVEAFKKETSPFLTSEYHTMYSNDEEYESLTKPLNLISFITSILIWVVFAAGIAIVLAIATIFVRDRKFEIGLLLSSGEGKAKIIGQFVFEMLVIAVVAFVISVGSSWIASKGVGNWIVDNQLLSQTSLIGSTGTQNEGSINQIVGRGRFNATPAVSVYGDVNMQSVADKYDVSINTAVIIKLLLASILLVLFGSTIPLLVITGYKPKLILQDY